MVKDNRRWRALWSSYLLFLSSAVLLFMVPPLLEEITAEIPLDDVQISLMQGVVAFPAVFLAILGGRIVDRMDSRRAGIVAGILMLGGNVVFNVVSDFTIMLVCRFIIGIGVILINLVAAKMLTLWFPQNERGMAMSVFNTAWPITVAIAYSTFVGAGRILGWRGTALAVSGFVAATLLVFIFWAPRDPKETQNIQQQTGLKDFATLPGQIWIVAACWFFFASSMISLLTFGAKFLSAGGTDYGFASMIVGLIMWLAIPFSLIAGWIIDRWGDLRNYMIVPALGVGLCLVGFTTGVDPMTMMIISGILAAFIPVAVYSLPGLLVPPHRLGLAFGVILTFSNLGNSLGLLAVGLINDMSGNYSSGMFVASILIACTGFGAVLLGRHRLAERKLPNLQGEA